MELEIFGDPLSLKRHRSSLKKMYDPNFCAKQNFAWKVQTLLPRNKNFPITQCINLSLEFYIRIPKSWPKRKKENFYAKPHTQKLDLDNLIKFVCDSLNGILWEDDCLVYSINASKYWSDSPRTIIKI